MPGGPTIEGARVYELSTFADACYRAAAWYLHDAEDADRGRSLARQLAANGLWALEQAIATYNRAGDLAENRVDRLNEQIANGRIAETDQQVAVKFSPRPPGLNIGAVALAVPKLPASEPAPVRRLSDEQLAQFDEIDRRQSERLSEEVF